MGFRDAVSTCLRKFVTISGRAPRAEYWYFYLFTILVSFVASGVDSLIFSTSWLDGGPLDGITSIVLLIPSIAVLVRRFHDVGKSGWQVLAVIVALFAGVIIMALTAESSTGVAAIIPGAVITLASFGYLLYVTLKRSDPGMNDYGPNPYEDPGMGLEEVFR